MAEIQPSDAEREILKYAGKMSDRESGERAGVSGSRVHQVRVKYGIAKSAAVSGPKPGKAGRKPKAASEAKPAGPVTAVRGAAGGDEVTLTLKWPLADARARLAALTPEQVGIALRAVLEAEARS